MIKSLWIKIILILFFLDYLSKIIAKILLSFNFPIKFKFLTLILIYNYSTAFNLFKNLNYIIIFISIIIIYNLYKLLLNINNKNLLGIAISIIIGSILGNLSERILHGYVTDFISFKLNKFCYIVFNLSDIGILIGLYIIIYDIIYNN
ncbi:Lipoprotein signal peptidase [Candidatus Johnevansia muelleri]|uniref:Lipoprotein signal peptidase n=1 Tax=Candidatus Johnevansia muelleri TaxID=1495769 RepID=A0A078KHX0_9GAMM|nr:Lipoprotein signal peptidase [Candidatus Evansia muelleri]